MAQQFWGIQRHFWEKKRNNFVYGVHGGKHENLWTSVQQVGHKEKCSTCQNSGVLGGWRAGRESVEFAIKNLDMVNFFFEREEWTGRPLKFLPAFFQGAYRGCHSYQIYYKLPKSYLGCPLPLLSQSLWASYSTSVQCPYIHRNNTLREISRGKVTIHHLLFRSSREKR